MVARTACIQNQRNGKANIQLQLERQVCSLMRLCRDPGAWPSTQGHQVPEWTFHALIRDQFLGIHRTPLPQTPLPGASAPVPAWEAHSRSFGVFGHITFPPHDPLFLGYFSRCHCRRRHDLGPLRSLVCYPSARGEGAVSLGVLLSAVPQAPPRGSCPAGEGRGPLHPNCHLPTGMFFTELEIQIFFYTVVNCPDF